jgi:inosine-uridine nucleoside N-ribohydrolase
MNPSIKENIRGVEIMGGALEVNGNVSLPDTGTLPAEWNIYIDPVASAEVFASGVPIRLTPLDSTDRVQWGESDALAWEASGGRVGSMAGQLLRQTMTDWSSPSVLIWDLVAALNASDRGLCSWEDLHIDVEVDEGISEGQTVVAPGEAVNASACFDPDPTASKDLAKAVFGRSE